MAWMLNNAAKESCCLKRHLEAAVIIVLTFC